MVSPPLVAGRQACQPGIAAAAVPSVADARAPTLRTQCPTILPPSQINAGEDLTVILEQLYASASDKVSLHA